MRVARFYGWSDFEVRNMDVQYLHEADLAMTQLDAQERIIDAKIAVYGLMKPKDANKFMKGLHKLAYPKLKDEKPKAIGPEQLMELLGGRR